TFNSSSVTFSWTAGTATGYLLFVGSTVNGTDILNSGIMTSLSRTVNSIPTDGRTIYVSLYSKVNGSWVSNKYTYQAFSASGTPTPTPTATATPTPTATPTATPTSTPSSNPAVTLISSPTSIRSNDTATFTVTASAPVSSSTSVRYSMSGAA